MLRVKVTEYFTLKAFDELQNIKRYDEKNRNNDGELYVGDTFDCTEEMCNYLSGDNKFKKTFVQVVDILPNIDIIPNATETASIEEIPNAIDEVKIKVLSQSPTDAIQKAINNDVETQIASVKRNKKKKASKK